VSKKRSEMTECELEAHRLSSRKSVAKYRLKYPERVRARARRLRAKNLEQHRARDRKYSATRISKLRGTAAYIAKARKDRLRIYGLTLENYDEIIRLQNGKCPICCSDLGLGNRRDPVDHDPVTGKVRGIPCRLCNLFRIGRNTLDTARAVVLYLAQFEII